MLNNDDSFNAFGLLKKYFGIRFFLSVTKFGHTNMLINKQDWGGGGATCLYIVVPYSGMCQK